MFYLFWAVGVALAITVTVLTVAKLEKSGYFDKYEENQDQQ